MGRPSNQTLSISAKTRENENWQHQSSMIDLLLCNQSSLMCYPREVFPEIRRRRVIISVIIHILTAYSNSSDAGLLISRGQMNLKHLSASRCLTDHYLKRLCETLQVLPLKRITDGKILSTHQQTPGTPEGQNCIPMWHTRLCAAREPGCWRTCDSHRPTCVSSKGAGCAQHWVALTREHHHYLSQPSCRCCSLSQSGWWPRRCSSQCPTWWRWQFGGCHHPKRWFWRDKWAQNTPYVTCIRYIHILLFPLIINGSNGRQSPLSAAEWVKLAETSGHAIHKYWMHHLHEFSVSLLEGNSNSHTQLV